MILPSMISTGVIGIDSRLSIVPRSISRVTDSAVKISMVMVRMVPTRPGTMLSWRRAGRVVARVGADLERRRAGVGHGAVVRERGLHELAERAPAPTPAATGSVASAATSSAGLSPRRTARSKFARDLDREQHLAGGEQLVELGFVCATDG